MQVALFNVAAGDSRALEELNGFLRSHRVLTLDREWQAGVWAFCVTYQEPAGAGAGGGLPERVDYKVLLDAPTFALFSHLRTVRKALAEKDTLPPYAVFTNEQLAEIARRRCALPADLEKIDGVGKARVEKYGAAVCAAIADYAKQQNQTGAGGGTGQPA